MKTALFAGAIVGLAFAGAVPAGAAGQPQLPPSVKAQESPQQEMHTKRALDANKYKQPLPQSAANENEQGGQPGQTGVGERGSKVAPSTAGQSDQPKTGQTGVGERGSKVAPSTNPAQGGQESR